jgi:hypothetical protein
MIDFQNWTNAFNLIHLPTAGADFTWDNGRRGLRYTERRLDRVVCNQSWMDMCATVKVSTLTKHKSDHYPLLLDFKSTTTSIASQFKFLRMWSLHPNCEKVIQDCWNSEIIGCPVFILSKKLKLVKETLKSWNKNCFGNVHDYDNSAEQNLHQIQRQIQLNGISDSLVQEEKLAHVDYENALSRQEFFWKEKANLNCT